MPVKGASVLILMQSPWVFSVEMGRVGFLQDLSGKVPMVAGLALRVERVVFWVGRAVVRVRAVRRVRVVKCMIAVGDVCFLCVGRY